MGLGVEFPAQFSFLNVGIPIVLYLVFRPPRQSTRDKRPLVTQEVVEFDYEIVFFFGEVSTLQIRTQVIYPSQPATLPTSQQTCGPRKGMLAAFAVGSNVGDEAGIFLLGPRPFVCITLLTAQSPHLLRETSKVQGLGIGNRG